ncbi:MAG TPA: glycoside hydrolase family 38 C-terminal domain-containing protein, partial [Oscillatoriaceae cyanobacterium]
ELRQAADTSLLPGVLSARTHLKIANAKAQTLLERWVEPFSALAALEGRAYPAALLRYAWKTLLKNHPHDSICGCSVDAVHRQMVTRFESVEQLGGQLRGEAFAVLAGEDPDADTHRQAGLRLYNPHPWAHVAAVEGELTLDCAADEPPVFSLLDEEEQPVSFEILAQERGVRVVNRSPEYPYNVPVVKLRLRVVAAVPALGYRTLKIERAPGGTATHPELYVGNHWIENRFFKVRAVDGRVEIFDKALEETIVHHFEDAGDRGDEYNFCPVDGDAVLSSASWHWDVKEIVEAGSTLRMRLKATWALPGGLFEDRLTRVGLEPLEIALDVRLHAGVRRVEFETHVTNRSKDHRFRAAFRLPGAIPRTTADTAFGWVTRDSAVPEKPWAEKPMGTYPMVSQVVVDRPTGSAGLSAVGLHEYEAVDDTLYLTLIRAVGWLSREDLSTRKGDAGPMLAAPEAQCLDTYRFRYAWASQDADECFGTLRRLGAEFVVPGALGAIADWQGAKEAMFLELDQPAWQMSALKVADAGVRLVLRLFNANSEPSSGTLTFGFPVRSVARARLDETPIEPAAVGADVLTTSLRGYEIATYLIEPATPLSIEQA